MTTCRLNTLYHEHVNQHHLQPCRQQQEIINALAPIIEHWQQPWYHWQHLLNRHPSQQQCFYLWGQVGQGKTMIINLAIEALAPLRVERIHYHALIMDLYKQLTGPDKLTLGALARQTRKRTDCLCIDEIVIREPFHVYAITQYLAELIRLGMHLLFTANTPLLAFPALSHARNREEVVALCERYITVCELNAGEDFRMQSCLDSINHIQVDAVFAQLSGHHPMQSGQLTIHGRAMDYLSCKNEVLVVDFHSFFSPPRNRQDYMLLCQQYSYILIDHAGPFKDHDQVQSFVNFYDIAYDLGIHCLLDPPYDISSAYSGEKLKRSFSRAVSRAKAMSHTLVQRIGL